MLVLRAVRLHIAFWALGAPVHFFGVLVASLMADVAFFIAITPASLGFREGGIMLAAPLMGVTRDVALAATVLDRIVFSTVIIIVGQFGMWRMVRPVFQHDARREQPA